MPIQSVLLVDDDPSIRRIAQISLGRVGGLDVQLASSGAEALAALAQGELPDIVLLDVMMPGMDGTTTFRALQDTPRTRDLPVVFMTAKVQTREVQSYLDLGAVGVIAKPFAPLELANQLRAIAAERCRGRGARPPPARAAFAGLVVFLSVGAVAMSDPVLGVFGAALLLAATGEVLLPTRYTLDADGVRLEGLLIHREHLWSHFTGWREVADGVVLEGGGRLAFQRRRRTLRLRGGPAALRERLEAAPIGATSGSS